MCRIWGGEGVCGGGVVDGFALWGGEGDSGPEGWVGPGRSLRLVAWMRLRVGSCGLSVLSLRGEGRKEGRKFRAAS